MRAATTSTPNASSAPRRTSSPRSNITTRKALAHRRRLYRGKKLPELEGAYIYGDYSTGHIWAVKHDSKAIVWHKKIAITTLKITAFAFDKDGELIVCHHSGKDDGGFFTLVPNTEKAATAFPKKLSESGLFDSVKDHKMKPSVVPYSVNATFWSDGAHKERFVALPPGEGIELTGNRGWKFPDRTVLVKSFALETTEGDAASRKWIETRFMTKQAGEWYGYSYVWNDDGTDATLLDAKGMDKTFTIKTANGERKQTWHYPSRAECMVCHSRAQNYDARALRVADEQDAHLPQRPEQQPDPRVRAPRHVQGGLARREQGPYSRRRQAAGRSATRESEHTAEPPAVRIHESTGRSL
ncbi:MAG: hypothetical protein U0792_06675 [Gemmataceae bacterium]